LCLLSCILKTDDGSGTESRLLDRTVALLYGRMEVMESTTSSTVHRLYRTTPKTKLPA
jgi:hypothetical protein